MFFIKKKKKTKQEPIRGIHHLCHPSCMDTPAPQMQMVTNLVETMQEGWGSTEGVLSQFLLRRSICASLKKLWHNCFRIVHSQFEVRLIFLTSV